MFNHKVILVTGGTGSFGKKFIEYVVSNYNPKKIIVFSRDEMKQFEMAKTHNGPNIRYFIGDVRDPQRLHRALNNVDIVVHAAALKIVPTAEYNPFEAVRTNVIGAENIINAAIDNDVEKVLALSTDKAANPVNLYGATKLCAEKMFVAANQYSPEGTQFSVVRYGNVIGSRGSVVPFFQEQSKEGSIPITDVRMTRFWLRLLDGVKFVISSLEQMEGAEVFIPKIPSMKVVDLATAIAPNCEQKIVGIRPGEKLHETLLSKDDLMFSVEKSDRYIIRPSKNPRSIIKIGETHLPDNFPGYHSDNNEDWLTVEDLRRLIEDI
ncbi:UDP-N-acetylglucosamine 4,6-dehydratase (inverting) [Candidatus Kuenenbacteria bacterium]|nr:UDP-N-acetylglucosamine 4,6-dehydratase (inverting) [Candidatus Kuenenbacteria bacterium]